jgi:RNA polymerase sigma-70 factor (ECF subfamily)
MEDDALLERLAAGDDAALRALFSRNAPWLAARLRALLPAPDVEDVIQETFLAVWRGARSYRPEGVAPAWIWGIARRQAAMMLRKRGAELRRASEGATGAGDEDPASTASARTDLKAAVSALGPAERDIWQLLYVEDRPVEEVAKRTGVPTGTVKSRSHRARRLLRAALGGHQAQEEE